MATRSKSKTSKRSSPLLKHMETSKKIVLMTGIFAAVQIEETMTLIVLFKEASSALLTICLSCITGYITILSWYFGKALGENKLKITQSMSGFHSSMSSIASHAKVKVDIEEDEDEDSDEKSDEEDSIG